jgi:WD40 repeat protein
MLGIQALTGIPANQLPEDPRTSEIIWRDREALPVDVEVEVSPQFADVLDKMVRYDYRQRFQTATEALQAIASLKNPSNYGDTSGTYTLTIPPASTANAVTATLPPQPSVSKALVTSAHLQDEVQAGNAPISTLDKKSYWLKGIGAGLVTATALTVGFYQLPNAKLLNTNQLLASGQKTSPVNTLIGHSNEVYSVAISPDGQILVSGSVDKKIKLWSMPDGKPLKTLPAHQDKVMSVAISPDGGIIASGSKDGSIKLWNLKTGQLLRALSGHSEYVLSVAFSPDGQTIATSSADKTVKLWDVRTGKQVRSLSGHSNWVYAVAFSPDGKTLADASDDKTIKLWHVPTGKLITTLSSPSGQVVRSVAFSPDGKTLVSGSYDQINLWKLENVLAGCKDASSCSPMKTFSGKLGIVDSIAISPDSQTLACGTKDKSIKLWNLQTGKLQDTISGLSDPVHTLTFSPDGKTLVSGGSEDGTIEVWRSR